MRLLLIRHGQTPSNVAGLLDTDAPGPGLTELGERQAAAVPGALADQGHLDGIEGLYVSKLVRTHLTAAPLAAATGLRPQLLPGVHEIEAGDLEDRHDVASYRAYLGPMFEWADGDLTARIPGGPDGHDFFGRYDPDVERVARAHPDGTAVIVSHGAAIRVWAGGRARNALGIGRTRELDNTGVVELEGDPDAGWLLRAWMGDPVAGDALADDSAIDPTGDLR